MVNSPMYVMYFDKLYKVEHQVGDKIFLSSLTEKYIYAWKDPRSILGNIPWQPVKDRRTWEDYLAVEKQYCTPIDPSVVDIIRSLNNE